MRKYKFRSAIHLIANSFKSEWIKLPCEPVKSICAFTGEKTDCIPRKYGVSKSFTDGCYLMAPGSDYISVEAYQVIKYKPQRMSSWIADGESFTKLKRVEVRPLVLDGAGREQWCGYVTTSYKKHGGIKTPPNTCNRAFWLFEVTLVDCSDRDKVNRWYGVMDNALRSGIGRNTLSSLNAPPVLLKKIGVQKWIEFERWARPRWQSPLYAFLVYLLPSIDEIKEEKKQAEEMEKEETSESETIKSKVSHGRQRTFF